MLATLHATKQPKGLRRLIIANAPPDFPSWGQAAIGVLPYLSAKAREAIAEGEQRGDRESEAYQAAMGEFSDYCGCRVQPPPDDLIATMHALEDDMTVPLSTFAYNPCFDSLVYFANFHQLRAIRVSGYWVARSTGHHDAPATDYRKHIVA